MKKLFALLMALLVALPPAQAQERQAYSQAELDQMLAPIALYPDSLLSQVLMASTYPLDVVEAARWARANPGLQGDEAVAAVADKEWDPSVKSLVAFPNLLARLDEKLEWTKRLGDAFLAQETQVMDSVQQLRQKARAAGQLAPDERVRVVEDGRTIVIEQADPRVVYVPYYDPWVVYGPWWWAGYPPVVWAPWPGYVVHRPGFWWGVGVGVSTGFFFGGVDWHHRHVRVVHVSNYYVRPRVVRPSGHVVQRPVHVGRWQHDGWHRRGVERPRIERRGEVRTQAMPPALRASNPQPRIGVQPERTERRVDRPQQRFEAQRPRQRTEAPRPQVRETAPRVEAPRAVQPRIGVQQPAARVESRPQQRFEQRGGGNGRGRNGGWRDQGGRGNGRN
jgi:hypothetical protein